MADTEPQFLQDAWTVYFHDPDDPDWALSSYHRVADVTSVADYWAVHEALEGHLARGMFFVMREHVYPCWDDKENINGGCLSMKVPKDDLPAAWAHLVQHMLGETVVRDPAAWATVNGLSVSPKRCFCIVKLWLRDASLCDRRAFALPPGYCGEVIFRSNTDNIRNNHARMVTQPPPPRAGYEISNIKLKKEP